MMRLMVLTLMAVVCALVAAPASAVVTYQQNFEGGLGTYGTSSYLYFAEPAVPASGYTTPKSSLYDEGTWGVGDNPHDFHISWATFGDHTPSGTNMMIVNGSTDAGVQIWGDTVNGLTAGQQYYFSAWMTSVYPQTGQPPIAPAVLAFSIDGTQLNGDITLSDPVGTWRQFYVPWTATGTSATISIVNKNTTAGGNDFALDDIYLDQGENIVPIPGAIVLGMIGTGLVGWSRRRRVV